jgi:hypothetical protein
MTTEGSRENMLAHFSRFVVENFQKVQDASETIDCEKLYIVDTKLLPTSASKSAFTDVCVFDRVSDSTDLRTK